jgi:predicted PurR-regulated permease PerM
MNLQAKQNPELPSSMLSASATSDATFVRRVLIIFALAALVAALRVLSDVLLLLFGSIIFARTQLALAQPLTKLGCRQGLALAIVALVGLAGVTAVLIFFGAEIARQFQDLISSFSSTLTELMKKLEATGMNDWLKNLDPMSGLQGLVPRVFAWTSSIVGAIVSLVLVIFGGLYIAADPGSYRDGLIKLIPPPYQANARATLADSSEALHQWLIAQLFVMVMVGTLTGLGLWLLGIKLALALGVLAGLFNFIPYLGSVAAAVITIIISAGQGTQAVVSAAAVMLVVQQLESYVITPFIVGRSVSISPAVGLFAIVATGILFGPLGLLLGYPLVIVADIAVRRLYVRDTLDEPVEILGHQAERSEAAQQHATS